MMDLLLYTGIRDYLYARIGYFTEVVLSKNLNLALTMVLALLTLWIMVQGYLIVTGRSQEGLKGFIFNLGKNYVVIAIALGVSLGSGFSVRVLTDNLANGISQVMHGSNDFGSECLTEQTSYITGCKIDLNLKTTQLVLSSLSAIDTADDDHLEDKLSEAKWFAGVGTAGPAVVAGTMLIMYRIAISLFVGFAPIFILCLLFKRTAPLFQKWLYFGLATIFSSVLLGVMAEISMDLVGNLFGGAAAGKFVATVIGEGGTTGIMETVTQQLGLGLMLSTLLITVPPMAGMWFNGVMGSFSAYSVIGNGNGNRQEVPPHLDGGASRQTNYNAQNFSSESNKQQSNNNYTTNPWTTGGSQTGSTTTDAMKQPGQPGKGNKPS
ncbi:MAG: type IV secretion system protein [Neisseria lactamica]|nr:type IV secretion system protein [Neisseria lactamica]